ncbi:MAG: Nif3-like dinuclear metal center hexameric protein [Christensenellaceae bacterium]|nr:Nif3-like dinuclear metal center hexameric protein [Christensenellaceae bacterium]
MAVSFDRFTDIIETAAPLGCAYSWDNSGRNVRVSDSVKKVMITLDVTESVIDQAEEQGCDTILSHHPLLFRETRKLDIDDPVTGLVIRAVRSGISLYAAHTSYDCAPGGLNCKLGEKLGLKNLSVFVPEQGSVEGMGLGVVGDFTEPMSFDALIARVGISLGQDHPRHNGISGKFMRAAVIGGAGGEFFREAKQAGAQVLITGEAKYNHFIDAAQMGILIVEAGHFETERIFIESMKAHLSESIKKEGLELEIVTAEVYPPCRTR